MESEAWVSFPLPLSRVLTSDRPSITRPLELKVAKPALVVEPWPTDGRGVGGGSPGGSVVTFPSPDCVSIKESEGYWRG